MDLRKVDTSNLSIEEVQQLADNMDEVELEDAALEGESRSNQTMLYPLKDEGGRFIKLPNYPHWTETYAVEARKTYEFLGHIGRLGGSNTWEYDTGLPQEGHKGRAKGMHSATMKLSEIMGVSDQ